MKKELWPFLIKLALSLTFLGYLWFFHIQPIYPKIISPLAVPFFQWAGVEKWRLTFLIDHFSNIIPFVALIIATPGFFINWKKTAIALTAGLVILFAGHLALSWVDYYFWSKYQMSKSFFTRTFHFYLLNDALPFGLWLLFYPRTLGHIFAFLQFGRNDKNTAENNG